MSLDELGTRICIMGPSNSGKSTLANSIGQARGLLPIHLDQFRHYPQTNWQPRSDEEFIALHDEAISNDNWVMDGNYSQCLQQRLERATGIILLDTPTITSLLRYIRRAWFESKRYGALVGNKDSIKWGMIYHIAIRTRENRRRYKVMFSRINLPKVRLATTRELNQFYCAEGLD
jgi:adenylate kinase family enzyme